MSKPESREPAPPSPSSPPVAASEEPSRQVEDEAVEPMPPADRSVARRVASGAVFIDCRVHGARPATVVGGEAVCGVGMGGGGKCAESAPVPARQKAGG